MNELPPKPFQRQIFFDQEHLVGARWWQESLRRADPVGRRKALKMLLILGGSAAAVALLSKLGSEDDDVDITMDALELQKREGWNAGNHGAALRWNNPSPLDVAGTASWRDALPSLASELAPAQASLAPFYVPTLFQSLISNDTLRAEVRPVAPAQGSADVLRGEAIVSLFEGAQMPKDIAVILDLPGPSAVAVASAMARAFEPVFTFDNWPHPLGVVPSHETLGAALYHRPVFLETRAKRPAAPPVFVLDRNRLAHYTDEDTQFDNRYVAKLPSAQALRALGIAHVLYVTPEKSDHELDDLNDDFVAFAGAQIDVKMLPLTDLDAPSGAAPVARSAHTHYYGGHPHTHLWFWRSYGWHTSRVASAPVSRPVTVSNGAAYRPVSRPTLFSSRTIGGGSGVGKQKPSGFGRVSVRTSKSSGSITGVRTGRSGSFGRAGSGWGG